MTTIISVTKALTMSVEDFQQLNASELAELHKLLADSKQKKALRKADLVSAVLKQKIAEAKAPKQEELPLVVAGAENSVKTLVKPKVPANASKAILNKIKAGQAKPKAEAPSEADPITEALKKGNAPKPKAKTPTPEELKALAGEQEAPQEQEKEVPKQEAPKHTLKRPQEAKPDFGTMTQEQLLAYIQQMEEKHERFPKMIEGEKTKYSRVEFEDVISIQKHLKDKPFTLYCLVDEKIDEKLTQFLVLFASPECLVILDRNRTKNSTTTIEMKNVTGTHLKFPKDKMQFEYAFYIKEKK